MYRINIRINSLQSPHTTKMLKQGKDAYQLASFVSATGKHRLRFSSSTSPSSPLNGLGVPPLPESLRFNDEDNVTETCEAEVLTSAASTASDSASGSTCSSPRCSCSARYSAVILFFIAGIWVRFCIISLGEKRRKWV